MVVRGDTPLPAGQPETPYTFITRLAANAPTQALVWLFGSALLSGAALLAVSRSYWPLSSLAGTLSTIALWGLLAHRAEHHPGPLIVVIQRLLVAVGAVLALGAGLAIFFGVLGPRWML